MQSNQEHVIPDGLPFTISDKSFTTFPKALRNAETRRLYTKNALFITFFICYSASYNAEYMYIGTFLSTSVIKSNALLPPLREPTEEVSR